MSAAITDSIAYLSSPLLLGASLTTRYVLPTLTVKTGSITFKRTEYMKKWGEGSPTDSTSRIDHDLMLTCSPAAQTLIQVLPYITTEAVLCRACLLFSQLAIVYPHLIAKAYSMLQFIKPSSAVTTLKSTQAAMSIDEIVVVINSFLPYASTKTIQYGLLQRKPPQLCHFLPYLYFPTESDDDYCTHIVHDHHE